MDKYHLRRALLKALEYHEPAPCTPSEIMDYPVISQAGVPLADAMGALRELEERRYLTNMKPGRAPLFRLMAAGRGQIRQEDDLDEFIWGEFASKFAGPQG